MPLFALPTLVAIGITWLVLRRRAAHEPTSAILHRFAKVIVGIQAFGIGAFAAGEALADPGGLEGAALAATWIVPLALLGMLVHLRPDTTAIVLTVIVAALLAVLVWSTVQGDEWQTWEDRNGPARALAVYVVATASGFLGWRRPEAAGVLLLILGVAPGAILALGAAESNPLVVLSFPLLIAGALFIATDKLEHAEHRGSTHDFGGGANLGDHPHAPPA